MLACADAGDIKFPVYASPKIDGVRALVKDGVVLSRTLKPIRNRKVQELFGKAEHGGFDGELVVGEPYAGDCMQKTTSGVMRIEGEPDVTFFVFDSWDKPGVPFRTRNPARFGGPRASPSLVFLHQVLVTNQVELDFYEQKCLSEGYEGVMIRSPGGMYKFGRATAKGGELSKVKRFVDSEATVTGVEERMHNDNVATTDELGRAKRSSHQENMRPAGDLGALVCRTPEGVEFKIGTGFSAQDRTDLWTIYTTDFSASAYAPPPVVGRIVKYKHFIAAGVKDAPRFPVFLGWRDPDDM